MCILNGFKIKIEIYINSHNKKKRKSLRRLIHAVGAMNSVDTFSLWQIKSYSDIMNYGIIEE